MSTYCTAHDCMASQALTKPFLSDDISVLADKIKMFDRRILFGQDQGGDHMCACANNENAATEPVTKMLRKSE